MEWRVNKKGGVKMRKTNILFVILSLIVILSAVTPAPAKANGFWPGVAVGAASGFVAGSLFYLPGAYYYDYQPVPVYPPPAYYLPLPIYIEPWGVRYGRGYYGHHWNYGRYRGYGHGHGYGGYGNGGSMHGGYGYGGYHH